VLIDSAQVICNLRQNYRISAAQYGILCSPHVYDSHIEALYHILQIVFSSSTRISSYWPPPTAFFAFLHVWQPPGCTNSSWTDLFLEQFVPMPNIRNHKLSSPAQRERESSVPSNHLRDRTDSIHQQSLPTTNELIFRTQRGY